MKTSLFRALLLVAITAGIFTGCVNDDDYSAPEVGACTEPNITANKTIAELKAAATATATKYTADDVVEGYVVSSDKGGNFYKQLYLVNADKSIGFNVQVNDVDLFNDYSVGSKVYIKLKDLYVQMRSNTLQIGALYNGNVGQIGEFEYPNHLLRSCPVNSKTEAELTTVVTDLNQINDNLVGKLVRLEGVQFNNASLGQTYYNSANVDPGGQTLLFITDASGDTVPFRTSSFAEYAGDQVSQNSGTITGVLTKFNTTYQFVSRYTSDIALSSERFGPGGGTCVEPVTSNKTIAEIFNASTSTATQYTADDIIDGYVVSSDQGGNFYKTLYLVSEDGSKGFSVQINKTSLYADYAVGKRVFIKLKDLYTQVRSNTLQIGELYQGNVGQIAAENIGDHIIKGCAEKTEAELTNNLTMATAINDQNIGKLIELDAVQFVDAAVGRTYFDAAAPNPGGQTNHLLTDAQANTVIFRTSSFSEYKDEVVPNNSGKVKGILTKFNSDYQFIARRTADINLTSARFTVDGTNPGGTGTALGGTALVYATSYNEDFESYAVQEPNGTVNYTPGQYTTFAKYVNHAYAGPRFWGMARFQNNKYIQMSAHNTGAAAKTYFAIPVNFTGGRTLQFKTKDGFNLQNGAVLKVYWSTTYTPGGTITAGTLNEITGFTIANAAPTGGYAQNFTDSTVKSVPAAATGNGFIIFEYTGSDISGAKTTMQLDDIKIN